MRGLQILVNTIIQIWLPEIHDLDQAQGIYILCTHSTKFHIILAYFSQKSLICCDFNHIY